MVLSVIAYAILGFVVGRRTSTTSHPALVIKAIYFAAAGIVFAILFLRRKLASPLTGNWDSKPLENGIQKTRAGYIVIYCLCESIGVLGLLALFIAASQTHFTVLVLLSLALMIFVYPKGAASINP